MSMMVNMVSNNSAVSIQPSSKMSSVSSSMSSSDSFVLGIEVVEIGVGALINAVKSIMEHRTDCLILISWPGRVKEVDG